MATLNKVFLIGRLTRDPVVRVTPKGNTVAEFGIAINRQYKDESGASRDETTFIDIEAWNKLADQVAKYVGKGSLVFVEGRTRMDSWRDKDTGQNRMKLKIVAEQIQFLDSRSSGEVAEDKGTEKGPQDGKEVAPRGTGEAKQTSDRPF